MLATDLSERIQPSDRAIRDAAILYLLLVVTSVFGFFAPDALIVSGDPAATVHNILASEALFRLAVLSGLVAAIIFIFLGRALYCLLAPVDRRAAALMVVLVLVSIPITFVGILGQVAALRLMHGGPSLAGLAAPQLNALAMFFLHFSSDTSSLNSIFFGLWLLPFALLVIKSGFIPRFIGYLLILAGVAYVIGAINFVLSPPFASVVFDVVGVGYIAELGVVVWLVLKAARLQFGRQQARSLSDSQIREVETW
jgi:Domain of unknown function (DUF4386)